MRGTAPRGGCGPSYWPLVVGQGDVHAFHGYLISPRHCRCILIESLANLLPTLNRHYWIEGRRMGLEGYRRDACADESGHEG